MFFATDKKFGCLFLISLLFLGQLNAMEQQPQESRLSALLKSTREYTGKLLFASSITAAALLGYTYRRSIKKCFDQCLRFCTGSLSIKSCFGSITINGNHEFDSSTWKIEQTEEKQIEITGQQDVRAINSDGKIEVDTHDLPLLLLKMVKKGKTQQDIEQIRARTVLSPSGLTICVEKASPQIKALIHYTLLLPRNKKISVLLNNISGAIIAQNINGDAEANCQSGSITLKKRCRK